MNNHKYLFFTLPTNEPLFTNFRTELFKRMKKEKLLPSAMHMFLAPSLEDWLKVTNPEYGHLLCCIKESHYLNITHIKPENICGIALINQFGHMKRVWSFDFTAFREHFSKAISMGQECLAWIFNNLPCDVLMGLTPKRNKHAWQIAQDVGFEIVCTVKDACYMARKYKYEDGVLVIAKRERFLRH